MKTLLVAAAALAAGTVLLALPTPRQSGPTVASAAALAVGSIRPEHLIHAATASMPRLSAPPGFPAPAATPDPVPAVARGGGFGEMIARHAQRNGVPLDLAHAVVRVESGFRPNARGQAGEVGLMQIKPATARLMGYRGRTSGLYDPETNIRYGMKYLGQAYRLGGGTTCGTVLRYNAGHGARRMNRISAAYCAKVKRLLAGRK